VPTGGVAQMRDDGAGILEWRGAAAFRTFGRLAPGASLDDARAEAAVVTQQLVSEYPDEHRGVSSIVLPEAQARPDPIFADFLPILSALFAGMVLMVLLIACANVANLMFARTALRQRELSMRAALGASRGQLIRQLLVESILLALMAGVVSWLLSMWGGVLLAEYAPKGDTPVAFETAPNWRDYVFAVAAALAAGVASGWWPAWRASRVDLNENLKAAAGGRVSAGRHWMRDVLVVGQVAFSLVVLVSAALFLRSLQEVRHVDLGFRPDHLLTASFDLKLQGYDEARAGVFQDEVLRRVQALPGVVDAGLTTHVPFDYNSQIREVFPENPPPTLQDGAVSVSYARVSPGFIDMLGLRMRQGRPFTAADTADTVRVAIVNRAFAQKCWPGEEAVGKRFQPWRDGPWIEIVGTTETAKYVMLTEEPRPFYYQPLAQEFSSPVTIMLRTAGDPAALMTAVRQAVREVDPHLPVYDVRVHAEIMGNSIFAYMPMRIGATLAGAQGIIGVFLALMGLYAVVAFGVSRRTREIGVRIALGAQPRAIVRAMLVEGIKLTVIGLAIGAVLAAGIGFVMSTKVYGLAPVEPVILLGVALLLLATAAFACWWPARRATRVNPIEALRAE
jgi:predicted permease